MIPTQFLTVYKEAKQKQQLKQQALEKRVKDKNGKLAGKIYSLCDRKLRSAKFIEQLVKYPGTSIPLVLPEKIKLNHELEVEITIIFKALNWRVIDFSRSQNTIFIQFPTEEG